MGITQEQQGLVDAITEAIQVVFQNQETFPCTAENLRITALETKVATMDLVVKNNEERIRGNGREGLEDTAKRHTQEIKELKEFVQEIKSIGKWLILLVAGLLTTSLISLILK